MAKRKSTSGQGTDDPGIDVRHRQHCPGPRHDARGRWQCCSPGYQAQYFDKRAGKPFRKTFDSLSTAKQWRSDAIKALESGEVVRTTSRTVGQALDELVTGMGSGAILDRSGRRYKPATVRSYEQAARTYLKPLAKLKLSEVRRADVQRIVGKMTAAGLSGSTVRNKLDPLRVVYRRALNAEEVNRNPTERLELPANDAKQRKPASLDRSEALLAALPDSERSAWAVAIYAGLRAGELRALRWTDIDFAAGVIRVERGWDDQEGEQDTKTAAGKRTVPLAGKVRSELERHQRDTGRSGTDLVFGRTASEAFTRSTMRARAIKAWTAAGLEPLTPHEGRHSAGSYMAKAGMDLIEARDALGHADTRTTANIYQHALPGWHEQAAAKLDAFYGGEQAAA